MLEDIVTDLYRRLIAVRVAKPEEIIGCSDEEVELVEKKYDVVFPTSYRLFLKTFGKAAGDFLRDADYLYDSLLTLTDEAKELMPDNGEPVLPDRTFVFSMRYREQFVFFVGKEP